MAYSPYQYSQLEVASKRRLSATC